MASDDVVARIREIERKVAADERWTNPEEARQDAEIAGGARWFDLAVEVLERWDNTTGANAVKRWQQLARWKSQDRNIPTEQRHKEALAILSRELQLETTETPETLGIAGGICKRWWLQDGQRVHLQKAIAYYARGHYRKDKTGDDGYTGINAAYLLDVLASSDASSDMPPELDLAGERFAKADEIREDILKRLPKIEATNDRWVLLTIAEAHIGLGNLEEARLAITKGALKVSSSERQTSLRQFADLARIQAKRSGRPPYPHAEAMLAGAFNVPPAALNSMAVGKVGLALSGGGFRASLFHIGVLARLAELDLLRHVEVLSCVSGGSIIGAYYYLALQAEWEKRKKAHQENTLERDAPNRQDYVNIVQNVADKFLAGVQKNIRTRIVTNIVTNAKMAFKSDYSRTDRAGELYEKVLFGPLLGTRKPLFINDMVIRPDDKSEFRPREDNWQQDPKVPILVINATTLNTGHQWQFTATYMGEPPQADAGIDAVERWRRVTYDSEVPTEYKKIRLGHAVGASAGVPGLFTPIVMRDLYPGRTVRLVDGGVHDNQGVAALLAEECTVLLVSDASGQLRALTEPGTGTFGVLRRSDDILQERMRDLQLVDLQGRRNAGVLHGLMFVHLTKGLDQLTLTTEKAAKKPAPAEAKDPNTKYFVRKNIQRKLSEIRTDLDSFSEAEAYALMASGYLMTLHGLTHDEVPTLIEKDATVSAGKWKFLELESALAGRDCAATEHLSHLLDSSPNLAFKVWNQAATLRAISLLFQPIATLVLLGASWWLWGKSFVLARLLGLVGLLIPIFAVRRGLGLKSKKSLEEMLVGLLGLFVLWPASFVHLHWFDRWYQKIGRWPPPKK